MYNSLEGCSNSALTNVPYRERKKTNQRHDYACDERHAAADSLLQDREMVNPPD